MLREVMCHESAADGVPPWRSASLPSLDCPHHNLSRSLVGGTGRCEGSRQAGQAFGGAMIDVPHVRIVSLVANTLFEKRVNTQSMSERSFAPAKAVARVLRGIHSISFKYYLKVLTNV